MVLLMENYKKFFGPVIIGLITSLVLSITSSFPIKNLFWGSWIFTSIGFFSINFLLNKFSCNKFTILIVVFSLLLRLGLGFITTYNLLDWGYEDEPYTSGYLFKDAYTRDNQAWDLATSDKPIWAAFSNDFFSDQYGGLLALSSFVYRIFTPNAHAQFNIIFLVSIINAIGIIFLAKGLLGYKGEETYSVTSKFILLIFSFYPDAILFSSSQMREPLLFGLSAILFWIVHEPKLKIISRIVMFLITSIVILFVSLKIGLFIIFSFFIWLLFKPYVLEYKFLKPKYLFPLIILFVIVSFYFSYNWIIEAAKWDALLLERNSGFVQYVVSIIGTRYRLAFASLYGLLQPVLPATLIEPSKLFWRIINSLRALGWYLLMPGLIYGLVYLFREKDKNRKVQFGVFWLISIFWIILSSVRAGGDMWDNPRYRISFLVFISYIVAQAFLYGWKSKDHWLTRIILAEVIFILFFLQWYIARYLGIFDNLPFMQMVGILSIIFIVIFVSGLVHEFGRKNKAKTNVTLS